MLDKIEPIFRNGDVPESLCFEHTYIRQPIKLIYPTRYEIMYACQYCKHIADWSEDKMKIDSFNEIRKNAGYD